MLKLNKEQLAVRHAVSRDVSREALTMICVEPDGRTVATDAHMLLQADACFQGQDKPEKADPEFAVLVDPNALYSLMRGSIGPAEHSGDDENFKGRFVVPGKNSTGTVDTCTTMDAFAEHKYPAWSQIMPKPERFKEGGGKADCLVNPELLIRACKAMLEHYKATLSPADKRDKQPCGMWLNIHGESEAITLDNGRGLRGVIMPMRRK